MALTKITFLNCKLINDNDWKNTLNSKDGYLKAKENDAGVHYVDLDKTDHKLFFPQNAVIQMTEKTLTYDSDKAKESIN